MEDKGIFFAIGKGVFWALLLIGLPALIVIWQYQNIQFWADEIQKLPVLKTLGDDFQSGQEVVGQIFAKQLQGYYQEKGSPEATPPSTTAYWTRQDQELRLLKRLSRRHRGNMQAYLEYIERYKPHAQREMQTHKIPASITLAQGLFESDAGRSTLARSTQNHFGIKCRLKPGYARDGRIGSEDFQHTAMAIGCVQFRDDYAWDRFEAYDSPAVSFRRHSELLLGQRYRWMIGQYAVGEQYTIPQKIYGTDIVPYYAAWAVGLKKSGYATAKTYAEKIIYIIETYQLWLVDYEVIKGFM